MRLQIVNPDEEVEATYEFHGGMGSTVSISGFHGTQVYTCSDHDNTLLIRLTGVSDFQEIEPKKVEPQEGENDAEAAQREAAEQIAAMNDSRENKGKRVLVDDGTTTRPMTIHDVDDGDLSAK